MPRATPQLDVIPLGQAINKYFELSLYLLVLMGFGAGGEVPGATLPRSPGAPSSGLLAGKDDAEPGPDDISWGGGGVLSSPSHVGRLSRGLLVWHRFFHGLQRSRAVGPDWADSA